MLVLSPPAADARTPSENPSSQREPLKEPREIHPLSPALGLRLARPRARGTAPAKSHRVMTQPNARNANPIRLLIVDDSPHILKTLT